MFIPLDSEDEDEGVSKGDKKKRREREAREARKQVRDVVRGWEGMLGGKYDVVGKVVGQEEERWGEVRELCEKAQEGRKRRGEGGQGKREGVRRAGDVG